MVAWNLTRIAVVAVDFADVAVDVAGVAGVAADIVGVAVVIGVVDVLPDGVAVVDADFGTVEFVVPGLELLALVLEPPSLAR